MVFFNYRSKETTVLGLSGEGSGLSISGLGFAVSGLMLRL